MPHPILQTVHPQWLPILGTALNTVDPQYLAKLQQHPNWLPGEKKLFAAFSLPLSNTKYILLGESPYPRSQSANGFAFWDNAVQELWAPTGFSRTVNRATSLRNFLKMLLKASGGLQLDYSQQAIANLDKTYYVKTAAEFFNSMLKHGFLLLNAALVYNQAAGVKFHAHKWQPFIYSIIHQLKKYNPKLKLLLFGRVAAHFATMNDSCIVAPHPYNLSFITNAKVLLFFKPLNLLQSPHNQQFMRSAPYDADRELTPKYVHKPP